MMNVPQIFDYAQKMDISICVDDEKIKLDAPEGGVSENFKRSIIAKKPHLIRILSGNILTQSELKYYAGEDWEMIRDDPEKLKVFADAVLNYTLIMQGEIPPDYTATTYCQSCKRLVSVPQELRNDGSVLGCMWCANRVKGQPIPFINNSNEQEVTNDDHERKN